MTPFGQVYDGRTVIPVVNLAPAPRPRLGQALTPPLTAANQALDCYRCGTQPPRLMTASMAAAYPGGCSKVDPTLCGGASTPASTAIGGADGPTQIRLSVLDASTLDGLPGAKVSVQAVPLTAGSTINVPSPLQPPAGAAAQAAGDGVTDQEGIFIFKGTAPSPNRAYFWRLTVSPGSNTPSFPTKSVDVPTRSAYAISSGLGPSYTSASAVAVTVVPSNTDPLVAAVAEAQLAFASIMAQCERAWGSGPQGKSFCADQAHANVPLNHPKLRAHWDTFSWWVGDFAISPKDWPKLVANFEQTKRVFDGIPFPEIPEAADLWRRCARGIPLWKGMGVANPQFYISDYFPREDRKIEADMATQYLINVPATAACMEHKIKQKAKEIARSAKTWRMLGMAATIMLAPLAAGASSTLIVTEAAEFAYQSLTGKVVPGAVSTIATGGVSIVAAGLSADAVEQLVSAGLQLLMQQYGEDLDPIVQKILSNAAPKVASAAVTDLLAGTTTVTDTVGSSAADFVSLQTLGSAAAAMAVKLIGNVISATGVRSVADFKKTILGLEDLPTLMVPFVVWCINTLLLDRLFDAAAELAQQENQAGGTPPSDGSTTPGTQPPSSSTPPGGTPPAGSSPPIGDLDMADDVVDPLVSEAQASGVDVPSSATEIRDPVISSGVSTGTVLATAGIGVGAIVTALLLGGVLGK